MYFVSKKLKKKHNITNERAALYEAAETWVDGLKGLQFLGLFFWHYDVVKLTLSYLLQILTYFVFPMFYRWVKS